MIVTCPKCQAPAVATETKYGTRHECCGLWSWDSKPLVSEATHEARKAAHAAFDILWKEKGWQRARAYAALAEAMQLPAKDCHIGSMTAEQAAMVPLVALKIAMEANR